MSLQLGVHLSRATMFVGSLCGAALLASFLPSTESVCVSVRHARIQGGECRGYKIMQPNVVM